MSVQIFIVRANGILAKYASEFYNGLSWVLVGFSTLLCCHTCSICGFVAYWCLGPVPGPVTAVTFSENEPIPLAPSIYVSDAVKAVIRATRPVDQKLRDAIVDWVATPRLRQVRALPAVYIGP